MKQGDIFKSKREREKGQQRTSDNSFRATGNTMDIIILDEKLDVTPIPRVPEPVTPRRSEPVTPKRSKPAIPKRPAGTGIQLRYEFDLETKARKEK